ncbi:SMP-30/gluconolactonase/LRE family protein [Hyphomonas johnsonii]|uniref:SMP-30/Gluconolactonase/LRE-like region domain-containing protein n=1 Tax=Hyphomonas johnsonii MHS-2 TaxID=1280950 RepID=A0A059FUC8_9PROT|nr:SMP-30/gluconolactonase/LRE family protein [Hyphomonas johnsonii]KCZ94217.1 hypothetical protein HJO_02545 [Hyphomonas johnsonii MHS-2]
MARGDSLFNGLSWLLVLTGAACSAQVTPADSGGEEPLAKVCGIPVPEDLVSVPGSDWIVTSSMPHDGSAGGLFLVNAKTHTVEPVLIAQDSAPSALGDEEAVTECRPPDPANLVTHGISIVAGEDGIHRLYVVGHGAREAIELFDISMRSKRPVVSWKGCVALPDGIEANSVAGLPDGGFLFTSLYDKGDGDWSSRISKLASAAAAGGVYEWQAGGAIAHRATPAISGPNGIAVSPDGEVVFLAGWGDRTLRRVDRQGRETVPHATLDFLPDNLHWAPDGSLLAAGQRTEVSDLFACMSKMDAPAYCVRSYSVARIDPDTLTIIETWDRDVTTGFGDSTSAIIVDGRLWIGSINGECLAHVDERSE